MEYQTTQNNNRLNNLLIISAILIVVSGYAAFKTKKEKNPQLTVRQFLGADMRYLTTASGIKTVMVGMVGGIIFGFIDNAGLWFGMDALDPLFVKKGITGNAAAGYGNTFSDGLGAFLGTFIAIIVSEKSNISLESTPIWANAVGVVVGCLIGIMFGQKFGRKK